MTRSRDDDAVRAQRDWLREHPPMLTGFFGIWLVSGRDANEPPACECDSRSHWRGPVPRTCPCLDRDDTLQLAQHCCAVRVAAGAILASAVAS
jgi:hypothetical protein